MSSATITVGIVALPLALGFGGITVLIKGVKDAHVDLFRHVGVLGALRDNRHLFDDLPSAIEHARSHVERASSRL